MEGGRWPPPVVHSRAAPSSYFWLDAVAVRLGPECWIPWRLLHKARRLYERDNREFCLARGSAPGAKSGVFATEKARREIVNLSQGYKNFRRRWFMQQPPWEATATHDAVFVTPLRAKTARGPPL